MKRLFALALLCVSSAATAPAAHACHHLQPINPQCWVHNADEAACATFKGFAGSYGPIYVDPSGDVWLAGEPFWDCPS